MTFPSHNIEPVRIQRITLERVRPGREYYVIHFNGNQTEVQRTLEPGVPMSRRERIILALVESLYQQQTILDIAQQPKEASPR